MTLSALAAMVAALTAPAPAAGRPVTLTANPDRICADPRPDPYLNFDLVIANPTADPLTVNEIKARAFDTAGTMIEQRVLWQDALGVLGPQRMIAAGAEGLIYNPFRFNAGARAQHIEYEVTLDKLAAPLTLSVRPQSCITKARLILPLTGRVIAYDGYDFLSHHRRQSYQSDPEMRAFGIVDNWYRFGIDLLPIDAKGALFRGTGARIDDWLGWEMPVRSPGAGVVAGVRDDLPDNPLGDESKRARRRLSEDPMVHDGNYVLIDHGRGEYSLVSHLRSGSATVTKGQRVIPGQIVAKVGNSGATPVPHLHYELRTGWGVKGVRSLPPYFHGVRPLGWDNRGRPIPVGTGDVLIAR